MGYSGETCQYLLTQTLCTSVGITNNCRNGGTCMLVGSTTQCFCPATYTGALCENTIDLCSLRVCQNGGSCSIVNGSNVLCQCLPTFQGQFCEYSIDPCAIQPCLNGGKCIASGLTFSCNCAQTMYTGPRCATIITSPCATNPVRKLVKKFIFINFILVCKWWYMSNCWFNVCLFMSINIYWSNMFSILIKSLYSNSMS